MITTPYIAQLTVSDFGQNVPDIKFSATLAASTNTQVTAPVTVNRYKALIKCETDAVVYFAVNEIAEVPAGATFAATTSEMIRVNGELCREVGKDDVLNFITAGTDIDVSIAFFNIRDNPGA